MKKYKYKVWDKDEHKWLELSGDIFMTYWDRQMQVLEGNGEYVEEYESIEIIEWTGLTAPGGRDIYEGYILECYASDGQHISKGVVSFEGCDYIVKYSEGSAEGFYYLHHILVDTITIIGNIFENPELIEGGNNNEN
jgi:hypothetical protein